MRVDSPELNRALCEQCFARLPSPIYWIGGTGYGLTDDNKRICYACCAEQDKRYMETHDRMGLYLVRIPSTTPRIYRLDRLYLTNWPDSLRFPAWRVGTDSYHIFDHTGTEWWGRHSSSNSQLIRMRKVKRHG